MSSIIAAIRNPLKRSASTASLPTPPRTHRKRARGRSNGSCESSTEDELPSLSSESDEKSGPSKKRRRGGLATAAAAAVVPDDEDMFWLGAPQAPPPPSSSAVPLLYRKSAGRNNNKTDEVVAPVSPPPSHRKRKSARIPSTLLKTPKNRPLPDVVEKPRIVSPPSTPRRMTRSAMRDSPENPFLATPVADSDSPGVTDSSANPSPHTPTYDKPYITYVFRGTRRTYQNPHYNHAEGRPLSPPPASKLPINHPDYSPSEICPPRRLFGRNKDLKNGGGGGGRDYMTRSKARIGRLPSRSLSPSSGEEVVNGLEFRPKKLDFAKIG